MLGYSKPDVGMDRNSAFMMDEVRAKSRQIEADSQMGR